jgi:hypothetical protein
VSIQANDDSATEGSAPGASALVSRTGATASALNVTYSVGGTATAGSDYTALSGNVTIPSGQSQAAITVTALNDAVVEANETVVITLTDGAAYDLANPSSATITIVSDDVQGLVLSGDTATVTEGSTSSAITVRLAAEPSASVIVTASRTAGDTDITVTGQRTFTTANWNTPQALVLTAAEDADTTNGVATITVSTTGVASATITVTESDNDAAPTVPTITFPTVGPVTGNTLALDVTVGGTGPITYTWTAPTTPSSVPVRFSSATTQDPTITFPMAGTYTIRLVAANAQGTDTENLTVTVTSDGAFAISGSVADDAVARAGLGVELIWTIPSPEAVILTSPTTSSGNFAFESLKGSATDFQVRVPGSP